MRLVSLADVPTLPADPAAVEAASDAARTAMANAAAAAESMTAAWAGLPGCYDAPDTPVLASALRPVESTLDEWLPVMKSICSALNEYAAALEAQRRELRDLREAIPSFARAAEEFAERQRVEMGPGYNDQVIYGPFYDDNLDYECRCRSAAAMIQTASEQCAADLGRISAPSPVLPPPSSPDAWAPMPSRAAFGDAVGRSLLDALTNRIGADGDGKALEKFLAQHPGYIDMIDGTGIDPQTVRTWWQGLDPRLAETLTVSGSTVIGALNGIPAMDRVAANRENVRRRLDELEGTTGHEAEIAYLNKVLSGERQLYLYDPARDRIIEMIGDPTTAERVITAIPGTWTEQGNFYDESIQKAWEYLVDRGNEAGTPTVAFVYKDGPWAQFGFATSLRDGSLPFWSDRSNANKAWMMDRSVGVAGFEAGLRVDPQLSSAQHVGFGHSAGLSILTGAETQGVHYDQVHSLSGSWIADGWKAGEGTTYYHHQNAIDAINNLDLVSNGSPLGLVDDVSTPLTDGAWQKNVHASSSVPLAGWIVSPVLSEVADGILNHIGTAAGPDTNQPILDEILDEMAG